MLLQVRTALETAITRCTRDGRRTFFDVDDFPWVPRVEAEWKTIRAEIEGLLIFQREQIPNFQDVSEEQKVLTAGDDWKTLFLYGYGHEIKRNVARCPETARIIRAIPGMETAMFSILAPRKHIPEHRGPYKGVLRYHLGLIIPKPNSCRIRVGTDVRSWEEGKSLVFDDSHWHEVWNDSDYNRVILFVDFVRPLPPPLSLLNRMMIDRISKTSMVSDAVARM